MAIKTSGGKDGENNRLSGRMRRYTRVGNSVGGLAMRMAGQRYLGMPNRCGAQRGATEPGVGWSQGAADESGAIARHHSGRPARRVY